MYVFLLVSCFFSVSSTNDDDFWPRKNLKYMVIRNLKYLRAALRTHIKWAKALRVKGQ